MGRVTYSMNVSADGYTEGLDGDINFTVIDEEIHRYFNDQARAMSTFLYGRRIYELMAAAWPTADQDPAAPEYAAEFARIWRDKPKIVFSSTLTEVAHNARLATADLAAEIARTDGELEVSGPNSRKRRSGKA
jgi:dihydrofolate reductase